MAEPHRIITQEHADAATKAASESKTPVGTLRATLKGFGYSDRDIRLQGVDVEPSAKVIKNVPRTSARWKRGQEQKPAQAEANTEDTAA